MALLPLLAVLGLALVVGATATLLRRAPTSRETTVADARRHAARTAAAAVALAVVAGLATAVLGRRWASGPSSLGVTALLVPVTAAVTHTAVLVVGELTWPRPLGDVRRARLVRRGLWTAAPRRLVVLSAIAWGATAAVVVLGWLLAAPDGRSIALSDQGGRVTSVAGPFPGPGYGGPAAAGLLLLGLLVIAALAAVADRPAVVTVDDRIETALRRASAHRVLRGATAAVLVVGGGLLHIGGQAVADAARSGDAAAIADHRVVALLGTALGVLGLIAVVSGVVVACLRAPGVPAERPLPVG